MVSLLRLLLPVFKLGDLAFGSPPPDVRRLAGGGMASKPQKAVSSGQKSALQTHAPAKIKQTRLMLCPFLRKSRVKLSSKK